MTVNMKRMNIINKRFFVAISFLLIILSAASKTTYIPAYWSYLKVFQYRGDSVSTQNILDQLESGSLDESFRITIVHEDITHEKVKAIKRAKAAAGWSLAAAVFAGLSTGFDASYYKNSLLDYINLRNLENTLLLSQILQEDASAEERLAIDYFIDNLSNHELMVSDLERGLVWYVLPHSSLQFELTNPGIEHLRISNLEQTNIQYADIIAANIVKKETIEWEDDECWIKTKEEYIKNKNYINKLYFYINKKTFESHQMSSEEVKLFKKK